MTKEEKQSMIDELSNSLDNNGVIYITDIWNAVYPLFVRVHMAVASISFAIFAAW